MNAQAEILRVIGERQPIGFADLRAACTQLTGRSRMPDVVRKLRMQHHIQIDAAGKYVLCPAALANRDEALAAEIMAVVVQYGPLAAEFIRDRLTIASASRFNSALRRLIRAGALLQDCTGVRLPSQSAPHRRRSVGRCRS